MHNYKNRKRSTEDFVSHSCEKFRHLSYITNKTFYLISKSMIINSWNIDFVELNWKKKRRSRNHLRIGTVCWFRLVVTQLLKNVVAGGRPFELNSNRNGFSWRRALDSAARWAITDAKLASRRGSCSWLFESVERRSVRGDGGGGKLHLSSLHFFKRFFACSISHWKSFLVSMSFVLFEFCKWKSLGNGGASGGELISISRFSDEFLLNVDIWFDEEFVRLLLFWSFFNLNNWLLVDEDNEHSSSPSVDELITFFVSFKDESRSGIWGFILQKSKKQISLFYHFDLIFLLDFNWF